MNILYILVAVSLCCSCISILIAIYLGIDLARAKREIERLEFRERVNYEYCDAEITGLDEVQTSMAGLVWDHNTNIEQLIKKVRILNDAIQIPNKDI